ncbi:unnamed protein product [Microthlaspi erraticum]|uniref:FBD domain-containing protein n=1 Tax=Microthlaspi erraticum TaxID=1685480 RepID=A0A6D2LQ00_9BRAS|nr:unnamed protein product [Microthlaspi erraticum]
MTFRMDRASAGLNRAQFMSVLLTSLGTLEWKDYEGTEEEKQVATFILRNGSCLKKVTISSIATDPNRKLEMLKELSSSPRRSPTCQLIFD